VRPRDEREAERRAAAVHADGRLCVDAFLLMAMLSWDHFFDAVAWLSIVLGGASRPGCTGE
jgi:hypothetical protein